MPRKSSRHHRRDRRRHSDDHVAAAPLPCPPPPQPVASRESEEAFLGDWQKWSKLVKTLEKVLSTRSDDAFVDADRLCPRQAFLVVHLDTRLASDPPDALGPQRETITRILSAALDLSEWAERLRCWDDLSLRFWANVFSSCMVQSIGDSAWINKWVRFVKAHGVRLLLRWNGTSRRVETLQGPLDEFLLKHRTLPIVLELQACSLSVENLRWVHSLLMNRDSQSISRVRGLYLNDNTLHTDGLNALAELLEDPTTTSINELQLNNTMPALASDVTSTSYVTAFRRVIAALFTSKGSDDTTGVSLSLESHGNFQCEHVEVVRSALWNATRPLKMLSLANVRIVGHRAIEQLSRVLFSPCLMSESGSDLNISGVECYDPFLRDTPMIAIRAVLKDQLVHQAVLRSQSAAPLVRRGFSGLIADGAGDSSCLCMRLIEVAGTNLQRLALRRDVLLNWNPATVALLEGCRNLEQLNLSKSSVYEDFRTPFWDRLSCRLASSLRVLDISDCFVLTDSFASLAMLSNLRYLALRGRHTDWSNRLEKLRPVLRSRCRLQYVEMDYPPVDCKGGGTSLDWCLRRISVSSDSKMALLSVLARHETQHPSWKRLNEEVIVAILQYAGSMSYCTVNWCRPRWLKPRRCIM